MQIAVTSIKVGERRREDYGDLQGLADSIARYGLLHPIVIDSDDRLVCGERRLRACRDLLKWDKIDARDIGDLTEAERREVELEENLRRKDLDAYEMAKWLVTQATDIAPIIFGNLPKKDSRGRKPKYQAPKADIAAAIGTNERDLHRAEQHVETADAFPFMQKPDWKQYHVLEAREKLATMPEEHREKIAPMLSEPGVPPVVAIKILSNLSTMPAEEREEIFTLYESEDVRDNALAKSKAAALPPSPDPRVININSALDELRRCIKMFPDDPLTHRFRVMIEELKALQEEIRQQHKERTA